MGGCLSEKRFLFSYASNLNLNLIHLNFEVEVKAALSLSQSGVSLTRFLGDLDVHIVQEGYQKLLRPRIHALLAVLHLHDLLRLAGRRAQEARRLGARPFPF